MTGNRADGATIFVRATVPGWHQWPDAPDRRGYLRFSHRHLFHVEVKMDVMHDDREVEFHDVLELLRVVFPGGDMGRKSCEGMAREVGEKMAREYARAVVVSVSEDGECGAMVRVAPDR